MTLREAIRITRLACQAKCLHTAQKRLQTVRERLNPAGKETDLPEMTAGDVLQLRLTSAGAESGLWHEYVMGRHPQYTSDLKSKRNMAADSLLRRRSQLLSWPALEEFWDCIDYYGPVPTLNPALGPCWLWTGRKHPDGYGVFRVPTYGIQGQTLKHGGKKLPVYVIMFILDRGRYPRPVCRHRCGNNVCINPRHLTNGSVRDNAKDRQRMGQTKGYPNAMVHSLSQLQAPVTEY